MDGRGQITSPGFWSTPVCGHGMDVNGGRFTPMGTKTPVSICKHEPPQAKPSQDPPKEVRPTPQPGMAVHIGNAGPQAAHVSTVPPGPAPPQGVHATNCPTEGSNFTLPTGHFGSGIGATGCLGKSAPMELIHGLGSQCSLACQYCNRWQQHGQSAASAGWLPPGWPRDAVSSQESISR